MMGVRMPSDERLAIEAWATGQEDKPSLSEAIRRLLTKALKAERTPKERASAAWKQRHQDRWAQRITDLAWRQRLDNLLQAAARIHGEAFVKEEASVLFGVKWKPADMLSPAPAESTSVSKPATGTSSAASAKETRQRRP